jgi:serine/threonine-protein kinase
LVALHGWGKTRDGRIYVVLDYVAGETLQQRARANRAGEAIPFVTKTLREIAGALASMHGVGLLHGDVKPGNVIIDRALDRAVLIDLGVGIFFERETNRQKGFGGGTPGYSAPEQFTNGELAPTADVYGLAATTYAMLAAHGPFESSDAGARIGAQMRGDVRPIAKHRPELPPEVESLLARSLSPDPSARPATVLDFVDALEHALKGETRAPRGEARKAARTSGRTFRLWREELRAHLGDAREAAIVASVAPAMRAVLEAPMRDDEWYDADAFVAYVNAASGESRTVEDVAESVVLHVIPDLLTSLNVARTMPTVMRVLPDIAARLHDWLDVEATSLGDSAIRLQLRMPTRFAPSMCRIYRGGARALAMSMGAHVEVEERACCARGDAACELEVRWLMTTEWS